MLVSDWLTQRVFRLSSQWHQNVKTVKNDLPTWCEVLSTMSTREDVLLAAAATVVILNNKRKTKKRRCWVRPSLLTRGKYCGETMVNK
ncbi:unnamed protein product, partial [Brenthis ino]